MFFREKCRKRQCQRLNSKYSKKGPDDELTSETTSLFEIETTNEACEIDEQEDNENFILAIIDLLIENVFHTDNLIISSDNNSTQNSDELQQVRKRPKLYPCPRCSKLFAQFPSAKKHCLTPKTDKKCICPDCNKSMWKKNLKQHKKSCSSTRKPRPAKSAIKCLTCETTFSSKQRLTSHIVKIHDIELGLQQSDTTASVKCPKCDFTHIKRSVVKGHIIKAHLNGVKFNCKYCDHSCVSLSGLRKHIKDIHSDTSARVRAIELESTSVNSQDQISDTPSPALSTLPSVSDVSNVNTDMAVAELSGSSVSNEDTFNETESMAISPVSHCDLASSSVLLHPNQVSTSNSEVDNVIQQLTKAVPQLVKPVTQQMGYIHQQSQDMVMPQQFPTASYQMLSSSHPMFTAPYPTFNAPRQMIAAPQYVLSCQSQPHQAYTAPHQLLMAPQSINPSQSCFSQIHGLYQNVPEMAVSHHPQNSMVTGSFPVSRILDFNEF